MGIAAPSGLADTSTTDADEPMAMRFFDIGSDKADGEKEPTTRFALIIGNDAYAGARLKNAGADASLIAETLGSLDFSVTLLRDATKSAIERAIVEFGLSLRRAGRKAVGIFYFAGHGVQEAAQNYLLPVDAEIPDTAFLVSAAVSVQILIDELAKAPAAAKVVILDACRNNPIPNAARATRDLRTGLAAMRDVPDGTLIVFSTAADSVAQDGRGPNGPYAVALAAALAAPNKLLHEVMFDVSRHVTDATDGVQRPALFVQGAPPAVVLIARSEDASGSANVPPVRDPIEPLPWLTGKVKLALLVVAFAAATGVTALVANKETILRFIAVAPQVTASARTRIALPADIRSVADRLGLSDAAAELIFLRQCLAAIHAGETDSLPDLKVLADSGQPAAALQMALLLSEGRPGLDINQPEAYRYAQKVAEDAQFWVRALAEKIVTGPTAAIKSDIGAALLHLAAEQGDTRAKAAVADNHLEKPADPSDLAGALRAFAGGDRGRKLRNAAQDEIGVALYVAGRAYLYGEYDFVRNQEEGYALLREAARHQNGEALAALAFASSTGMGTKFNPIEAIAWARLAIGNDANDKQTDSLTQTLNLMRMSINPESIADLNTILPEAPDEGTPR